MAADTIERFGNSRIQHGPANDRVYLLKLDPADLPGILVHINNLVRRYGYTKIFAKIPAAALPPFAQEGYRIEAAVPGFYGGSEDGLFLVRYHSRERREDPAAEHIEGVLQTAREKTGGKGRERLGDGMQCRLAGPEDCPQMARLFQRVFASYPFPIDDAEHLRKAMSEDVLYAGIWQAGKLLAAAAAEMDRKAANAEMTDFATHPDHRGGGLAGFLLAELEKMAAGKGIQTGYTIARAVSPGMNITFARSGYQFGGTLINNTQISGSLESMNIWYKSLTV